MEEQEEEKCVPKKQRKKASGHQRAIKVHPVSDTALINTAPVKKKIARTAKKQQDTSAASQEISAVYEPCNDATRTEDTKRRRSKAKNLQGNKSQRNKVEEPLTQTLPTKQQWWGHSEKYVGAHMSIQGGIWNAVLDAKQIGARAFGLFLVSQRTWKSKPLDKEAAEKFRKSCRDLGFESRYILPHSPYLMNLGSPKPEVLQKSRDLLVEELSRCQRLGLTLYNIHPGSHVGAMPVADCLELIADGINNAHSQVPGITVVLENMSCQGSTIGGRFDELRGIIDQVKDKTRIGVCLDTCHAFAAGHDLSQKAGLKKMLDQFDEVVGLSYLKAVHLNDSKGTVGCRLDRHENIGRGHIGLEGFRQVMNEPRLNGIPMILETPYSATDEDSSKEIALLYSLCEDEGEA
ncbi:probable endonuclease 4 [Bombina bombina]|uniref:probable endonuclease 4 n=1 Tax=Bombina bombina TaxID=8345 RepID=UPI00235A904E|nr:probable endonuclease 4 [Bombina bombina]